MPHKDELLAWFRRGLSITPAEAVDQFSNYRLADTVFNLREDGHRIDTELMIRRNDFGRTIRYAKYHYIHGPKGETHQAASVPAPLDDTPAERQANIVRRMWGAVFGDPQ